MFASFSKWLKSKRRWITYGAVGVVSLGVVVVAGHAAYRRHTLPDRVGRGLTLFEHRWQPNDPLSHGGDGLGPVYNEVSCVACHFQGGVGGGGPSSKNVAGFEVLPTKQRPKVVGGVVHASATRDDLRETFQAVTALYPVIPGGITVVSGCTTRQQDFNPVVRAVINTPSLFGAGLIDGISGWSIHGDGLRRSAEELNKELSSDFSGTPIGRVRTLSAGRVGKFGWKGQFATLADFVATACAVELGLTNPEKSQMLPGGFREDAGAALDMTARQLDDLVSYVAELPRPVEILPDDPREREAAIHGKAVFAKVGCANCHTPDMGGVEGVYSDFRLYDIEPPNAAGYAVKSTLSILPDDHPKAAEWKTPPLWGVADSAPYFHDGASQTLNDAIVRHDGAAKKSRQEFKKLSGSDRQALMAFLGTLRAPR